MSSAFDNLADLGSLARRSDPGSSRRRSAFPHRASGTDSAPVRDDDRNENTEEGHAMKRFLSVAVVATGVLRAGRRGGRADGRPDVRAHVRPHGRGDGTRDDGRRHDGSRHDGGSGRRVELPRMAAASGATEAALITEEKAKELAQQYADQYLKGFTVERVLPFTGQARHDVLRRAEGPRGSGADLPRQSVGQRDAVRRSGARG